MFRQFLLLNHNPYFILRMMRCSYRNRKLLLLISRAPTKAESQEPAYSQALNQNKINRQRSRSRESRRQTADSYGGWCLELRRGGRYGENLKTAPFIYHPLNCPKAWNVLFPNYPRSAESGKVSISLLDSGTWVCSSGKFYSFIAYNVNFSSCWRCTSLAVFIALSDSNSINCSKSDWPFY